VTPDELINLYFDNELTARQMAQLDAWVRRDKAHARHFARRQMVHAALAERLQQPITEADAAAADYMPDSKSTPLGEVSADLLAETIQQERIARIEREAAAALAKQQAELERERDRESWARRVGMVQQKPVEVKGGWYIPYSAFYIGIAALLAVALSLGLPMLRSLMEEEPREITQEEQPQPPEPQPVVVERPVVATLNITLDAVWAERTVEVREGEDHAPAPLQRGAQLREGDSYRLTEGFAQFDTKRGAIVTLEAPSSIEFLGENHIKLTRGRLVGRCITDRSKGLVVDTPSTRVVDISTEFGVEVEDDGTTHSAVFDGLVEMREPVTASNQRPRTIQITGGWSGRVDRSSGLPKQLIRNAMSDRVFARHVPATPRDWSAHAGRYSDHTARPLPDRCSRPAYGLGFAS